MHKLRSLLSGHPHILPLTVAAGSTWSFDGAIIRIGVGRDSGSAAVLDDWVMEHEMTHLALPRLPGDQRWAMEGNAAYVEPIARVQAGQLDPVARSDSTIGRNWPPSGAH